jgi:hypothetical protein
MNITQVNLDIFPAFSEKTRDYPENGVFMPQMQEVVLDYGNFQWTHILDSAMNFEALCPPNETTLQSMWNQKAGLRRK